MRRAGSIVIIISIIVALLLVSTAFYTVDQTQQAIVLQLGKPLEGVKGPGLHFKIPFVQQVKRFERRLLEYDAPPTEILAKDKKNLVVDNYSKWRIVDPLRFYKTVRTVIGARARLDDIIYSQLRVELGKHDLIEIISKKRNAIMVKVTEKSNEIAQKYGIEIVDVRIKRADLPEQNEKNVFDRMRAERERESKRYRSEGEEEALKIRAQADKQRTIILAEAKKKAEILKGEGEAIALRIYAEAFSQDPEFFEFYRTMQAYRKSLKGKMILILSPEAEFFKFLKKYR